ncbi:MAG TPA: hypothetical protein VLK82_28295 [Candidatus Tectomicrobia bacterium]|nr:hypothetical protein [Candidatus Tectomicrobia bacterium]
MPQGAIPTSIVDKNARHTLEWKIHWLFRLALFCEFVGHGVFGILTKSAWVPYFGTFGIPDSWAWRLMPLVGSVDITLGTLALLAPTRAGLLYMGCWGLFTALLRPLAGEGWWEFLERSYNFGVPLLMLWVHGVGTRGTSWFTLITEVPQFSAARAQTAQLALRGMMASMLIGHGGFGLVMAKQNLLQFYEAAGLGAVALPLPTTRAVIGGFEMILGVLCLEAKVSAFFVFVCAWKLATELLYVPAGAYGAWWEVMERGSSYAAPLLWIGFRQVLSGHGEAAQGLISRRWWRELGEGYRK